MKRVVKALLMPVLVLASSLLYFMPGTALATGTAKLYLSPSSAVIAQGSILEVQVFEDSSGDGINAVQANLVYPTALLTYGSITSSSAFPVDGGSSGGNGTVTISRRTTSAVTGVQLVATVRFTAVTQTGTATISFSKDSQVVRAKDNQPETLTTLTGSYTLVAPSSASTSTNSPSNANGSSVDITPPMISGLTVSNLGLNTATIQWTTNVPTTSEVDYGYSKSYTWKIVDGTMTKSHKAPLDSKNLTQGTTYHYMVTSYDSAQNSVNSGDRTFQTLSPPAPKKSKTGEFILLGLLIVILLGGIGGALYYLRKNGMFTSGQNTPPPGQTQGPATAPLPETEKKPPSPPAAG